MTDRLLQSLTDAQREAVETVDGPLLILAGPGSGKTRVVTHRVAHMLNSGIAGRNILALTFTNKAADEMKNRVEQLAPGSHVWMGTFHSFCARLLRMHGHLVGLAENFTIFDTQDSKRALKSVLAQEEIYLTHTSPEAIADEISWAKSALLNPEEYEPRRSSRFTPVGEITKRVYKLYQDYLIKNNAADFDDLLLHIATLLRDNHELRETLDERYRYIMVDEYQDTNVAQYMIVRALSINNPNLSVTGDPDQSIYSWRGATISNILEFEKDYPNTKVVKLEQNYRSTKRILRVADALIANNTKRKHKDLFTENPEGDQVRLVQFPDGRSEADAIVEQIQALVGQGKASYKDFSVFYRTNVLSRPVESALRSHQIPYQIVRGLEFFQRKEVKDIVAYLQVLNNPNNNVALERVINTPTRGIGKKSIEHLVGHAHRYDLTMLEACRECGLIESLSKRAAVSVSKFVTILDVLATQVHEPLGHLVKEVVDNTGYLEYVQLQDEKADEDREANVHELISAAEEFQREFPDDGLDEFLETVSLTSDTDDIDADPDRVTLMTLHAAKGLEYPRVFIIGVEQGLLPHERSRDDDRAYEEERRLLFVGITRAEETLQLSYTARRMTRGTFRPAIASPFLLELPREEMDVHMPTPASAWNASGFEPNEFFHDDVPDDEAWLQDSVDAEFEEVDVKAKPAVPDVAEQLASMVRPAASMATGSTKQEKLAQIPQLSEGIIVLHAEYGTGVIKQMSGKDEKFTISVEFGVDEKFSKRFRWVFAPLMIVRAE